jgi:hypothetical protein
VSAQGGDVRGHGVEIPVTEAEGTSADPFEVPNLEEVKFAHIRLMRAYVSVIAAASRMKPPAKPVVDSLLQPFLVRRFVGRHIRQKFAELGTIYLQLGQATYDEQTQSVDPWLSRTSESCIAAAKRLPKWPLPGIAVVTSIALPTVGLLRKIHGSGIALAGVTLSVLVFIFLCFAFGAGRRAYLAKRELFLPKAREIDKQDPDIQKQAVTGNVYYLEDELYRTLQREKKSEKQLDKLLAFWVVCIAFYLTLLVLIIFNAAFYWWFVSAAAYIIALSALGPWLARKRSWQ